jgi:ribonuclease HI
MAFGKYRQTRCGNMGGFSQELIGTAVETGDDGGFVAGYFESEQYGTNNLGELLAIHAALAYAVRNKLESIEVVTSSQTADWWCKGNIGKKVKDRQKVVALVEAINDLRQKVACEISWVALGDNAAYKIFVEATSVGCR